MTDIDTDYQAISIKLDTLLGVAPWPMGHLPEKQCLDRFRQLGFKDPVKFHLDDGVSTLVFPNQ
jgi:hypothetical protein